MTDFEPNQPEHKPSPVSFIKTLNPLAYVFIVLAIIFVLYQLIGGALALAVGGAELNKNINLVRAILSFGQFMLILAPTIFFARLQSSNLKETFRLRVPNFYLFFLAIIGIITIQPLLQAILFFQDLLLNSIPFLKGGYHQVKEIFDQVEASTMKIVTAYSPLEFAVVTFVIAVTPAICEEFLFRGFALKNLEKTAKLSAAIFLSGFLFGMYHFQPMNIIPLVMLGCFLAFITHYTDSIYPAVLCHFLNNFLAAYFIFKYGKQDIATPKLSNSEMSDVAIFGGMACMIFILTCIMIYRIGSHDIRKRGK